MNAVAYQQREFRRQAEPWLADQREVCETKARFGQFPIENCARHLASRIADELLAWGHMYLSPPEFFAAGIVAVERAYTRCVGRDWIENVQVASLALIFEHGTKHRAYLMDAVDERVKALDFLPVNAQVWWVRRAT